MSHRNGTWAWHTRTTSLRSAAAASASAPPWLPPVTAIRGDAPEPASSSAASTASAASVNSRV
ncbi:MAG TPA: hypothetical protein VGD91_25820 [Trebonia sp.]